MEVDLTKIVQSPNQVRAVFNDEELWELAESIKEHGLLQPIKVRPTDQGYELVYGHRRVSAMRLLGWTKCEAIVEGVAEENSLVQSIVENLQRQDLNILDEAHSYQILIDRGHTLKEIANLVKKPQGRVSNRLSILRLPSQVQKLVISRKGQHETTTERGGLSPDSASRIASAAKTPDEAVALAHKALNENLNSKEVRELTSLLKETPIPYQRKQIIHTAWQMTREEPGQKQERQMVKSSAASRTEPLNILMHRKIVWNLHRLHLDQFDHFTIGYSERTLDQFLEILHLARVELVADVRRVPISRFRPEFSKNNLDKILTEQGVKYSHWPELGIPSEIRNTLQTSDLFAWYESNVQLELELAQHDPEMSTKRVAFMCVEVDPQSCHRHCIAAYLEKRGYQLLDL
jgi:ParB family chromosome partitioning protein